MFGKVFKSVYEKPKTENYFLKKRYIYIYILKRKKKRKEKESLIGGWS
jgi:hypothetical protein